MKKLKSWISSEKRERVRREWKKICLRKLTPPKPIFLFSYVRELNQKEMCLGMFIGSVWWSIMKLCVIFLFSKQRKHINTKSLQELLQQQFTNQTKVTNSALKGALLRPLPRPLTHCEELQVIERRKYTHRKAVAQMTSKIDERWETG